MSKICDFLDVEFNTQTTPKTRKHFISNLYEGKLSSIIYHENSGHLLVQLILILVIKKKSLAKILPDKYEYWSTTVFPNEENVAAFLSSKMSDHT